MVLGIRGLYEYVETDSGDPSLLLHTPPILALENGVTVLIGTLTQCFFAQRLWILSERNVVLVSAIACQMVTTVAFPGRFLFILFVRLAGKLHCNTLFVTLNARKSMKGYSSTASVTQLSSYFLSETTNATLSGHVPARGTAGRAAVESLAKSVSQRHVQIDDTVHQSYSSSIGVVGDV
ncbi:hypothetical protein V8D89_010522 [Ganoderma adspersum]